MITEFISASCHFTDVNLLLFFPRLSSKLQGRFFMSLKKAKK